MPCSIMPVARRPWKVLAVSAAAAVAAATLAQLSLPDARPYSVACSCSISKTAGEKWNELPVNRKLRPQAVTASEVSA